MGLQVLPGGLVIKPCFRKRQDAAGPGARLFKTQQGRAGLAPGPFSTPCRQLCGSRRPLNEPAYLHSVSG